MDAANTRGRAWLAGVLGLLGLSGLLVGCSGGDDARAGTGGTGAAAGGGNGGTGSTGTGTGATSGGGTHSGGTSSGGSPGSGGTVGASSAAEVARKLGRDPVFLIGMGNDLPGDYVWDNAGAYSLGVTLDLHYVYLTYGWESWNEGGWFANIIADVDDAHGVIPMSTLYAMAGWGENNLDVLTNAEYMTPYWDALKLLFQRYGADFGKPAVVHLEPDFWAYAQIATEGDPTAQAVLLHPDCADLPGDLTGMGRCMVKLARDNAPNVVLGFHASGWGGPDGAAVGSFLNRIGGNEADLVVIDMLDRDAGCFEAGAPECTRQGEFYWDETNQTSPNFHEHLAWAKAVSDTMGKPILWWQLPFGVPSDTPGGTPGHYRDNRVKYLFEHVQEFVDAGGLGATFGVGAGNQTYIDSDGGQFERAVNAYFAAPVALP